MNPVNADFINRFINNITCSTTNVQAGSAAIATGLFNTIAVISIAWLAFNHLLRKNTDLVDVHLDLIRSLIYLNFFYLFIVHYNDITNVVFPAIQQIGNLLGAKAGASVDINPGNIINMGFQLSKQILTRLVTFHLFRSACMVPATLVAAGVVLYCFTFIAVELILVNVGSKIILAGGIFLLAFAGLPWTRDYAERYVHTFFHVGIKIIFIYILVGIGVAQARDWAQQLDSCPWDKLYDTEVAVMVCAYIFYKLCQKLPDHAVSYLTGRLAMGYETAAEVKAAAKAAVSAPFKIAKKVGEGIPKMAGYGRAWGAASQEAKGTLATEGKAANAWNMTQETLRTLGAASNEVAMQAWERKVADSTGGKMAKVIGDAVKIVKANPQITKAGEIATDYMI